jgi:hypothetical protein
LKRSRVSDALVLVAGVLIALGVGEIALRVFWPQRSGVTLGMFQPDPFAGYSLRPEYEDEVRLPEYRKRIRIDADGYRVGTGEETTHGVGPRLLVIGDSFTFGVGVNGEEAVPDRIERKLEAVSPDRWWVRNGGVGGYGPLRSAKLLTGRQAAWQPDLVVHVLYAGNDLQDPRPETYLEDPRVKRGRLLSPGQHPFTSARLFLRSHSHLYAFLRERLFGVYSSTVLAERSRYLDPIGLREWPASIGQTTWPAGQAAIAEIRDWCAERGTSYLVAVAPPRWQVDDEAWARYRQAWGRPPDAFDRERVTGEIMDALAELGVETVDLLPVFREAHAGGTRLYYRHDPHWTPEGHELAADVLVEELAARGWLAGRTRRAVAGVGAPDDAG